MPALAEATLDALPEHLCVLDRSGTIIWVNRAWRRFAELNGGAPELTAPGANYLAVCAATPGVGDAFRAGLLDVLEGRRDRFSQEYPCHSPTKAQWFVATATRVEVEGQPHVVVTHNDVTAQRETQEMVSLFVRHSPIFAYIKEVTATQSRVVQASEIFAQMVGIPGSQLVGKTMTDLFPPAMAAQMTADDWQVVSGGKVLEIDETLDGRRYHSVKFPIALHAHKTMLGGYTIDVTEQKRAEETRRELEHRLHHAQKDDSLRVMAAGIAHQFNNLLMVIQGYLELSRRDDGLPDDPLRADAEDATRRAATISGSMLSYLGQDVLHREPHDLSLEVTNLAPQLRALLPRGVQLAFDAPVELLWSTIDAGGLRRVVMNLASNAWEAVAAKGGTVRLAVHPAASPPPSAEEPGRAPHPGPWVCLEVSDDGPGMTPEILERIFDPFFSTRFAGRGLGLSVTRGIVRACGGHITVDSTPGHGTSVKVYLPQSTQAELGAPRPIIATERRVAPRRQPRPGAVLVVDDEPLVLGASERLLQHLGYEVLTARSGEEALTLFRHHADAIGSVVLDLNMPGLDGWQVLAALRAQRPDVYVVVASGLDVAQLKLERREVQPDGWLQKPFGAAPLAAALHRADG